MIKKILKRVLLTIGVIIAAVVFCIVSFLTFLTVAEYNPADVEDLDIKGHARTNYAVGEKLTIMSWNIGYAALGDNADFYLDGGKMVKSSDKKRVRENLSAIVTTIDTLEPDLFFLQEVDRDSSRSYNIDETTQLRDSFYGFESTYGINYKAPFVPYPFPPLGKVDAGIMTFTSAHADSASRYQLPVAFGWPVKTVNLKRCVTKTHIPLYALEDKPKAVEKAEPPETDEEGPVVTPDTETQETPKKSGKDLVLFNLHLEASDKGDAKVAQTKKLIELLQEERAKGNYVIAGGDFNQIFSTADQDAYPAQPGKWQPGRIDTETFGEGWQFLMDDETPSCRSLDRPYADAEKDDFQFYLIDGFVISDNVKVNDFYTLDLDFRNSDHNPVVLEFTTKK